MALERLKGGLCNQQASKHYHTGRLRWVIETYGEDSLEHALEALTLPPRCTRPRNHDGLHYFHLERSAEVLRP